MIAGTGGAGGTDWASLRLDQMWAMLASHDPEASARLIGGWRQSHELAQRHLAEVRDYRERLAAAWDPSRSRAAAAYFTRLDALIANLEETSEAAIANQRAFAGATGALQSARRQMAEIHREHTANEVLLAAFAEEKRLYQLSPGKARGVPPRRPVPEGRQAVLEARARLVMQSLSTELSRAQSALVIPAPYKPDFSTPEAHRLPLPRTPPALTDPRPPARPPTPAEAPPSAGRASPPGIRANPVIGGARPAAGSTAGAAGPDPAGPLGRGPATPRSAMDGLVLGRSETFGRPGRAERPGGSEPLGRPGRAEGPGRSGMPPKPGAPANGVIGSTQPRSAAAPPPLNGMIGRRPPRPRDHRPGHSPDIVWETAEGVPPIIEPAPDDPPGPDPGPTIGRIHRNRP